MTACSRYGEQLEIAALEFSDVKGDEDLREHLRACVGCREALNEYRESWLLLPAALPKNPISKHVEAQLIERVRSAPAAAIDRSNGRHSSRAVFGKYALAVSILVALLTASMFGLFRWGNWDVQNNSDLARIKQLAEQLERLEQLERVFASPHVHYVSFRSAEPYGDEQGFFVYDLLGGEGYFFGVNLRTANDLTYRLWLLGDNDVVLGSRTIAVDADGVGAAVIRLPGDVSILREVVVSAEAGPPLESPSSDVRMRTKVDLTQLP